MNYLCKNTFKANNKGQIFVYGVNHCYLKMYYAELVFN